MFKYCKNCNKLFDGRYSSDYLPYDVDTAGRDLSGTISLRSYCPICGEVLLGSGLSGDMTKDDWLNLIFNNFSFFEEYSGLEVKDLLEGVSKMKDEGYTDFFIIKCVLG